MTSTLSLAVTSAVLCLAQCLPISPAQAQLMRTFVSAAAGNDANDCSFATPCRSFQGAHDKTLPDGEITVLAAGGYGAVTITKAISIVNDGVGEAGALVSGGTTGITINAPADAHVNLRGLTIQGIGFGGGTGLLFSSGFALTITNCVFRNHTGPGIAFEPNVAGTQNLAMSNTLAADNGSFGVFIKPVTTGVTVRAVIGGVRTVNNRITGVQIEGASATGTLDVAIMDSVSANNGQDGYEVFSVNGQATVNLAVTRSMVAHNNRSGISAEGSPLARLRVGQSVVAGNARTMLVTSGSVLQSFGDNYIAGNADGDPAPPLIARK